MQLVKEPAKLTFRKDEFEISYHSYFCSDSGEHFTTDELDIINTTQVHNMYRVKYGIPFPEEIRQIRDQYGISAAKMSEILGFGTNSYRLYESGEIPSVANGRLILAVKHPKDFIKQVHASLHLLSEKETTSIIESAEQALGETRRKAFEYHMRKLVFRHDYPSEFTGYRIPSFDKIANVISFFGNQDKNLFKTKLNKLLFYADFKHFKKTGFSITGLCYKAIPFGTVPEEYDMLYVKLADDEKIQINETVVGEIYCEKLDGLQPFDESLFDQKELDVLDEVIQQFKNMSTKEVVDQNHNEAAWKENVDSREKISYQRYAFNLLN